jgi:hypothetical protein
MGIESIVEKLQTLEDVTKKVMSIRNQN